MSNPVQLLNNFDKLGLLRMCEYFPNYQEVINREAIPFTEALMGLTNREPAFRSDRKVERAVENARFPVIRALKDFDFYFQPSINRQEILDLQHMGFLEKAENIIFIGNSAVGKTHLATASEWKLAIKAYLLSSIVINYINFKVHIPLLSFLTTALLITSIIWLNLKKMFNIDRFLFLFLMCYVPGIFFSIFNLFISQQTLKITPFINMLVVQMILLFSLLGLYLINIYIIKYLGGVNFEKK